MSIDVSAGAELEVSTGAAAAHRRPHPGRRRPTNPMYDTLIPAQGSSVVMPASGAGVIFFQGPPPGQIWYVREVVWTGADDHTAVANAFCAPYIASGAGQLLGQLLVPGQAVPGFVTFNHGVAPMHAGEQLVLVFYGAAAATPLNGLARVEKYDDQLVQANQVPA